MINRELCWKCTTDDGWVRSKQKGGGEGFLKVTHKDSRKTFDDLLDARMGIFCRAKALGSGRKVFDFSSMDVGDLIQEGDDVPVGCPYVLEQVVDYD